MSTKDEIIKRVGMKAFNNDLYGGCSQAVLGALQEELGIGDLASFKSATALSGGGAYRGETCGALIGALMAIGLVLGREKMEDEAAFWRASDACQPVVERFKEELKKQFGFNKQLESTLCREIQERIYGRSFDFTQEQERQAFLDAGGHTEKGCLTTCAISAAVAADELLKLKER
jgi:C_GCAxxG_C_C family probable redox protein